MKILETHIVPAISHKVRLQEYAVSIFSNIQSKSGLKKAIKKGLILIDGNKARTGDWIQQGQKIELLQPEDHNKKVFPLDIEVLYEDEYLAVVHKPAGYPTSGNYFKTIENALPHNLRRSRQKDRLLYPLPAHRLDNPTSGILLCAKTKSSLIQLQKAFSEKNIFKTYYALVLGRFENEIKLTSEIEGKSAITEISPERFFKIEDKIYTLVKAKPLTGRTHQIRIHLSRNMTPIVGDKIYGPELEGYFKNKSLFLFSGGITFTHPEKKKELKFEIQLPKRFRNLNNYRVH